jgi:hypothetical protein
MGNLTPGATYTYERDGDVIYAREVGETERTLVGWGYKKPHSNKVIEEATMWLEIRQMAKTNPALQKALDYAIMLYQLSKDNYKNER